MDRLQESMNRNRTLNPMQDALNVMKETGEGPLGWEDWSHETIFSNWPLLLIAIGATIIFLINVFKVIGGGK